MKYFKTVTMKDGGTCSIRNGMQQDAQGVWDNFVLTHGETEYQTTCPEEVTFTLEQEEAYLKQREESDRDAEKFDFSANEAQRLRLFRRVENGEIQEVNECRKR